MEVSEAVQKQIDEHLFRRQRLHAQQRGKDMAEFTTSMKEFDNSDRARVAEKTLKYFAKKMGMHETDQTTVQDLLTDIFHYADRADVRIHEALRNAWGMYAQEKEEDDEGDWKTKSVERPLWWLSFADGSKPKGSQFLGVAIVRGANVMEAARNAGRFSINPGGEVLGRPIPKNLEVPQWAIHKLLTAEECHKLDDELQAQLTKKAETLKDVDQCPACEEGSIQTEPDGAVTCGKCDATFRQPTSSAQEEAPQATARSRGRCRSK